MKTFKEILESNILQNIKKYINNIDTNQGDPGDYNAELKLFKKMLKDKKFSKKINWNELKNILKKDYNSDIKKLGVNINDMKWMIDGI